MAGLINLRLLTDFFNKIDPKPTSPRTVNQSWLKQLTASFDDLVGAGRGGCRRPRKKRRRLCRL
jgi:hypothetical protein